jgi:hypothetical protein
MENLLKKLLALFIKPKQRRHTKPIPHEPSGRPRYIDRGGMTVYPQPVISPGMELFGFVLQGNEQNLQHLVDKYLNHPRFGNSTARPADAPLFRPLSSIVVLTFGSLPKLTSQPPPYDRMTWLKEQEVAFWILIWDPETKLPLAFNPYIFVDHPWALSAGREIYGYPKEFAWLQMPEDQEHAESFSLDTVAVREFASEDSSLSEARRRRLLEIHRIGGDFRELGLSFKTLIHELARILLGRDPELLPAFLHLLEEWESTGEKRLGVLFLKQFRDLTDGLKAGYQGVVQAQAQLGTAHGMGLLGLYELELVDLESHPIVQELGLELKDGKVETPGFWMEVDFVLGNGGPI